MCVCVRVCVCVCVCACACVCVCVCARAFCVLASKVTVPTTSPELSGDVQHGITFCNTCKASSRPVGSARHTE